MRKVLTAILGVATLAYGIDGPAIAEPSVPIVSQKTLDFLASFSFPSAPTGSGKAFLPSGTFASWTAEERASVPTQVAKNCTFLWGMAHDDPATRFLPPGSPEADEEALGVNVCLLGHMPQDWPQRAERLSATKAIFERAAAQGSNLKMPATVK